MGRIKVKLNNPLPTRDMIGKYKNFDSLMDRYKKYYTTSGIRYMFVHEKRKLVYIVIILLMLLLFVLGEL